MSLKDFVIRKEQVAFRGGVLEVRGLALNDVTVLIRDHLTELSRLFELYDNDETRNTAMAESAKFAIELIKESPQVVASMIALSSDEPSLVNVAAQLPLPVQVETVRKIIELTFEEAGGAKKFLDSLVELVSGVMPLRLTP
jgi:hypothetical protein